MSKTHIPKAQVVQTTTPQRSITQKVKTYGNGYSVTQVDGEFRLQNGSGQTIAKAAILQQIDDEYMLY